MNIKQKELLLQRKIKLSKNVIQQINKDKYQDVLFAILKCTGQSNTLIGDSENKIDVEIVNAKIPSLLRKSYLKKANAVIDLQNNSENV